MPSRARHHSSGSSPPRRKQRSTLAGGALNGIKKPEKGLVIRGGRGLEDHMQCLWDLFRTIPSLEIEGASVLDKFYWLNKNDPNYSLCRLTENRGQDAYTDKLFTLNDNAQKELIRVFPATRESTEGKRIMDVFGKDFPGGVSSGSTGARCSPSRTGTRRWR